MFKIIIGVVIGVFITIAALNPNDAKNMTSKSVDALHSGYVAGSKAMNEPVTIPAPATVVAPVTDAVKKVVQQ